MTPYPTRRRQRLEGFDYATAGFYFVTVCVQNRLPLFDHVISGQMQPSPAGEAVEQIMQRISTRHAGVTLDTVTTMPDHVHAILCLDGATPSLSDLVHWFKSQSTVRYVRGVRDEVWPRFAGTLWQRGFYDRVIRTDDELNAIREYIMTNPARWEQRQSEDR